MRCKISKLKIPTLALAMLLAPASVVSAQLEPPPPSMTVLQEPIDYSGSNPESQSTNDARDDATNAISGFTQPGPVSQSIPEPATAIGVAFAAGLGLLRKQNKRASQ